MKNEVVDPQTRSLKVRLKFDNPDARLKPNMYSRININTGAFTALSIPFEALIRTGAQARVVKDLGDGKFRSVLVQTGRRVGDWVEVLKGLSEHDKVVTSAQFLLDSESSITADLARFEQPVNDTVWMDGILQRTRSSTLNITHAPVDEWGWPAMTMNFQLSPGVDMSAVKQGQAIRFEVEKTAMGGYQVVSVEMLAQSPAGLPDSGSNHEGMDHTGHDMSGMDHKGMGHEAMDHEAMDHEAMDHEAMDHEAMRHSGHDMPGMDHEGIEGIDHSSHTMPAIDHSKMGH